MQEEMSPQELKDRLSFIETMILEGRRSTESWGWTFVLWGVAFYIALAWAAWRPSAVAWPVTMVCSFVLTLIIGFRKGSSQPATTIGRAVTYVWISVGISMLLIFSALGFTGRIEQHSFVALLAAMLGAANAASGLILRWKMQIASGVVWWAVSVAACFGSLTQVLALFLAAVFFGQIIFGIHAMISESRRSKQNTAHA